MITNVLNLICMDKDLLHVLAKTLVFFSDVKYKGRVYESNNYIVNISEPIHRHKMQTLSHILKGMNFHKYNVLILC